MIPSRWSSAIAILRRRQRWREEDLRLVHELRVAGAPGHHPHALEHGDGDGGHDDEEPAFIVRWFLPQPPPPPPA